MKFGQILSNPNLGGKVLLGGGINWASIFNGQEGNIGIAVIAFVSIFILVIALCWFTCFGRNKEGMSQMGAGMGVPPSTDTFGYGLFNRDAVQPADADSDPMGHSIEGTARQHAEAAQTAIFHRKEAQHAGIEGFDPDAWVSGQEDYVDYEKEVPLQELFADPLTKTLGYAPAVVPIEGMADEGDSAYVLARDTKIYDPIVVPSASRVGEGQWITALGTAKIKKAFAHRAQEKAMENMADVGPTVSIQNVGTPVFGLEEDKPGQLEAYRNMKVPKRSRYSRSEHMVNPNLCAREGEVKLLSGRGVNPNSVNIGHHVGYNPFCDPPAPVVGNLRLAGRRFHAKEGAQEGFGLAGYHKKKGYLGSLGGSLPRGNSYDNLGVDATNMAYTTDKVKFLSMFDNKDLAHVIEDKCDEHGRCDIKYVGGPKSKGKMLNMIYQLSPTERKELKDISKKYTRYQLNSRSRIAALVNKKKVAGTNANITFTAVDERELSNLQKFINENGPEIDRFQTLSEKAAVRLSQKQYIVSGHAPSNACKVRPGLRYYGPSGRLQRLTKYVPANSCNYQDYASRPGAATNLNDADFAKVSDAVAASRKQSA